ncbi:sulfatase-like hydrolase/transferase [Halopseudomonas bauzanensis]|uniref:sulfatase-like hydrolase/transferase n=1 Tax=Halopseudomonas bauzanensis TaxID=653930 RepID=UPI002556BC48|nr:sulfatase-like hydrolase/transferase [Halopseudomonas bauzanensis]
MDVIAANDEFLRVARNFSVGALVLDVFLFFGVQLLLIMVVSWVAVLSARGLQVLFDFSDCRASLTSVLGFVVLLHLLNSLLFPVSRTAFPMAGVWVQFIIIIVSVCLIGVALFASLRRHRFLLLLIMATMLAFYACDISFSTSATEREKVYTSESKPNVIIIGVDALRPKELEYFGGRRNVMPFLDSFLQRAEVFSQCYTPAARTHAAWVSILSGRYPYHHGARFNLTEDKLIDKENLLTHALKNEGYRTVWGLDERRFNNIDESYGFDAVVGPKIGAADFLIAKFSDNPIVNLLSNIKFAKQLFPYIYLNRANFVTYIPYRFNDELVEAMKGDAPVFLSAHLTLPHYPFVNHLMNPVSDSVEGGVHYRNYLSMLELVDRQLSNLFGKLHEAGFLQNAIVYLISDHGEGFPSVDDGLMKGNPYSEFQVDSYGHGTNVMTLSQYHTLLGRVEFVDGLVVSEARKSSRLSSLIDIAPDVSRRLGVSSNYLFDGLALDVVYPDRYVVLESSFSNDAVSASRINQLEILQQSADAYYVAEDGRLLLRGALYQEFNRAKQRAVIGSDGVMVAVFPDENESVFVVDIPNSTWWPSHPHVPLDSSVWRKHLGRLCDFYKEDITFEKSKLCLLSSEL